MTAGSSILARGQRHARIAGACCARLQVPNRVHGVVDREEDGPQPCDRELAPKAWQRMHQRARDAHGRRAEVHDVVAWRRAESPPAPLRHSPQHRLGKVG